MRKTTGIALVTGCLTLALAACGERPESGDAGESSARHNPTAAAANPDFKACMVSDSTGFDDKSFNQTSLKGQTDAAAKLGVETAEVESTGNEQYADNVDQLVRQNCDEITTVGFLLGDATLAAAKANPDIDFAIVDYAFVDDMGKDISPPNAKGLVYATEQPAYLAGYLAAAMSKSGVVGTFGGMNIPPVTTYMEGFRQGVEKYNDDNGADVQLLGWDGTDGSFTENFDDKTKGQSIAEQLIAQGTDILFPVAGTAGLGGLQAVKEAGGKGIWVDTDGYHSTEYGEILLTSVVKGIDVSVTEAIRASVDGSFDNEVYRGTLANGGAALAPFHDLEAEIPQQLKDELEELEQGIIDGSITVTPTAR